MLRVAFQNIRENLRASALSALGVAVASIAIVLLVSIGLGVQKDLTDQIDELGVGLLIVVPGKIDFGTFNPNLAGKSFLSEAAANEAAKVKGVSRVTKFSFAGGGIKAGKNEAYPIIIATTPHWFTMHSAKIKSGRPFATGDGPVCVLGSVAEEDLFGKQSALGKQVEVNGQKYKVVGVIESPKGQNSPFSMFSFANVAYIPLDQLRATQPDLQIDRIIIQASPEREPKALVADVQTALGKHLTDQQFSVLTQEDLLKLAFDVVGILGTLVIGLTSIALVVGGLGIMSVMLMNVGSRTVEIGVRKAVGATNWQVFLQFLAESAITGLIGVLAGVAVSLVACTAIAAFTNIKPLVTWGTVALTSSVGIGLGCLFGAYPAFRASRLDPVEALRRY